MLPGPPAYDDATTEADPRARGQGRGRGGLIFETDDCRRTYEELKAAGVEVTQEPTERFYGTDCALRDPFGNPIRITQPPDGPIVVPSAASAEVPTRTRPPSPRARRAAGPSLEDQPASFRGSIRVQAQARRLRDEPV